MRLSAPNRRSSTTNLVHDVRRDRSISEIVEGAIEEHQAGTSFMVGLAAAVAGTYGKVAGAAMGVLGHGSNTTSGDRGVEAKTVQQLSDHISQRTSSERSLRSTVVVHSDQAEYETIQTRIVTNYNTGHDWVEKVFEAQLSARTEAGRVVITDVLGVATDVYTWKLLCRDRGLSRDQTEQRMQYLVDAILASPAEES
jgi:hypothetical protein